MNARACFQVILFAKRYNLMLTVRSSGHSFTGRSTHDGSVVINLARMKGRTFNLDSPRNQAGEVTVESGNTWFEIYEAVMFHWINCIVMCHNVNVPLTVFLTDSLLLVAFLDGKFSVQSQINNIALFWLLQRFTLKLLIIDNVLQFCKDLVSQ